MATNLKVSPSRKESVSIHIELPPRRHLSHSARVVAPSPKTPAEERWQLESALSVAGSTYYAEQSLQRLLQVTGCYVEEGRRSRDGVIHDGGRALLLVPG